LDKIEAMITVRKGSAVTGTILADHFGCHKSTISRILKRAGYALEKGTLKKLN
jgi:hypothetical protein